MLLARPQVGLFQLLPARPGAAAALGGGGRHRKEEEGSEEDCEL